MMVFGASSVAWSASLHDLYLTQDKKVGYVEDLQIEKRQAATKPLWLPSPPPPESAPLKDVIFAESISSELVTRYEEKFGHTQAEQLLNFSTSNQFESVRTPQGAYVTAVQANDAQRQYGEFMMRRLAEWHMDNYVKNDRQMKPVYELKQKMSKVEVEVAPGVSFQSNYSFSGNSLDMVMKNPYVETKARFIMGGQPESTLSLSRGLTPTVGLENYTMFSNGTTSLIARKSLSSTFSTSLQASTFFKDGYTPRESLYLAGMRIVF